MIKANLKKIARSYAAACPEDFTWKEHVFPRYQAPILVAENGQQVVRSFHFGLIPFYEREIKPKRVFHNARVETLAEKVSFKKPYFESRCAIPIESFIEYVTGDQGKKKRVQFAPSSGELMSAAGIYTLWRSPDGTIVPSFAIITCEPPSAVLAAGHDRCPLFLSPEAVSNWVIEGRKGQEELGQLLELRDRIDITCSSLD